MFFNSFVSDSDATKLLLAILSDTIRQRLKINIIKQAFNFFYCITPFWVVVNNMPDITFIPIKQKLTHLKIGGFSFARYYETAPLSVAIHTFRLPALTTT